jgi:hypothetical protein
MPTINARDVPGELYQDAHAVRQKGGRCFLAIPAGPPLAGYCDNCNGSGRLLLQVIAGGPFDQPVPTKGHRCATDVAGQDQGSLMDIDGVWFLARIKAYTCPSCNGANRPRVTRSRPTQQHMNALREKLR